MKHSTIIEIGKIKNLMDINILTEQVAPVVNLLRSLVKNYGDDVLKTIKKSEDVTDDILKQLKNPNATITDDISEKILKSIDWDSLAAVIIKKIDSKNELAEQYLLKMLQEGSNIQTLKKAVENKFKNDTPFSGFPPVLRNRIIKVFEEKIDTLLNNNELLNKLLLNLNISQITAKLSKTDIELLTKKGFNNFRELSVDFLNKSQNLFREAQSIIKELTSTQPVKTTKEQEVLIMRLDEKIKKIQQLDRYMYGDIKMWVNNNLNSKVVQEEFIKNKINEIFTNYNSIQPLLNNFWSKWGLQQAWNSFKESYSGIQSAYKKIKGSPKNLVSSTFDASFGQAIKETSKGLELIKKGMNFLIGTRRTIGEYRVLAEQIGVPKTIISFATEAILLKAISISIIITSLTFIRDFLGFILRIGSTNNQALNNFFNQWKSPSPGETGIVFQFKRYFSMFLKDVIKYLKFPGTAAKLAFGYGENFVVFLNIFMEMNEEERDSLYKRANELIEQGELELRDIESNIRTPTTQSQLGSFEHFKAVYRDENARDLGDGRFQHSDGTIYKWDSTEQWYEPQS
jgi:hypothetical protein